MKSPSLRLALLFPLLAAACGPAPASVVPVPGSAAPRLSSDGDKPAAAAAPAHLLADDLDIQITFRPEVSLVRVTITARPDDAPLTAWTSARSLDFVEPPRANDAGGQIGTTVTPPGQPTKITLDRTPHGVTWLTYAVRAELPAYPNPPPIAVDPDRFEGSGEALLALPSALAEKTLRAALRTETDEIGTAELVSAASSLGHGSRVDTKVRGADLTDTFFIAGLMGRATFRAPEGNDDAAWLGYTAFDPRPVFADMAGLRTSLRQIFGEADTDKLSFLFLSDSRPSGSFVVSRRLRSVITRIGVQEPWTAPVRIAVAAAVVHGWIGSRLWVGPDEPSREWQAYWFTEGVTRHLARDLLFRYGLISPADAATEVEGLATVLATAEAAGLSNEELAKRPRGALPVIIARGALYALRVDSLLRAKTGKKRTLENVLRELYQQAAAEKKALPAKAWVDLLAKDLGDGEKAVFRDAIELGKAIDLPDSALGPCFRKVTRSYVGFDLGFDEEASSKGSPRKVTGLVKGGPAEKAGLREGDDLVTLQLGARSPSEQVSVTVARGEQNKTFKYKPEGKHGRGPGFDRKKDVADEACTQ